MVLKTDSKLPRPSPLNREWSADLAERSVVASSGILLRRSAD